MFYTRKGDTGTTKLFNTEKEKRISKSSCTFEALGSLDELNSFLGLCKVKSKEKIFQDVIGVIQRNLFIIQAELAGSLMTIPEAKVKAMEEVIDAIEKELPPVKTFFIPGGTESSALFDFARTIARRTERRVIESVEKEETKIGSHSLAYLNRLSSLLYALARLANHKAGIKEEAPDYK